MKKKYNRDEHHTERSRQAINSLERAQEDSLVSYLDLPLEWKNYWKIQTLTIDPFHRCRCHLLYPCAFLQQQKSLLMEYYCFSDRDDDHDVYPFPLLGFDRK